MNCLFKKYIYEKNTNSLIHPKVDYTNSPQSLMVTF